MGKPINFAGYPILDPCPYFRSTMKYHTEEQINKNHDKTYRILRTIRRNFFYEKLPPQFRWVLYSELIQKCPPFARTQALSLSGHSSIAARMVSIGISATTDIKERFKLAIVEFPLSKESSDQGANFVMSGVSEHVTTRTGSEDMEKCLNLIAAVMYKVLHLKPNHGSRIGYETKGFSRAIRKRSLA